jgi:hypothetical protein
LQPDSVRLQSVDYFTAQQVLQIRQQNPGLQIDEDPEIFGYSLTKLRFCQDILLIIVPLVSFVLLLSLFTLIKLIWACKRWREHRRFARM